MHSAETLLGNYFIVEK